MTMKRSASWLGGLLGSYRRQIALALLLGLVTYGCSALLMFTSGYLISKTADAATTLFMVMVPVAFVQLFGLGRPVAHYFERLVSHDWVLRITSQLRLRLFQAADRLGASPQGGRLLGEYLAVLTEDVGHLQNLFLRVVFPVAMALLLFVGACAFCGAFSLQLLALMALTGAACVLLLPYLALLANRASIRWAHGATEREYARLTDDMLGAADWLMAGRGAQAAADNGERCEAVAHAQARVRRRIGTFQLASALLLGAGAAAMAWLSGADFGQAGADRNLIAAFTLGFFPLIEVFLLLPAATSDAVAHSRAIEGLDGLMATDGLPNGPRTAPPAPTAPLPRALAVEARDVVFAYGAGQPAVIDGLSLTVPAGASIALLGRSGAGKSTLISLLRGFLEPQEGQVLLDGIAVADQDRPLHQLVGYLGQAPYILNRSLRENLNLAGRPLDDARLAAIMESVGLGPRLATLPRGLDTVMGETGEGLSGGEAHRVALARILAADTPLVILDEPFSALDPDTERALMDTLLQVLRGRTLIVVTHHLAQVDRFDQVAFIEDGRVALQGTPDELRERSGYFRALCEFDRPLAL